MSKIQHHLFELIQSLSGSEKRYFRLFTTMQSGNKQYLKLFNALGEQKRYEEKLIIKQLANEKFVKNLTEIKGYLYKLILKSMKVYHAGTSINRQLTGMLEDIEFLYNKTLYFQCERIIAKAKKLATTHDKFEQLIVLGMWEASLLHSSYLVERYKNRINQISEIEHSTRTSLRKLENERSYLWINLKLFFRMSIKGSSRSKKDNKILEQLINSPLLKNEKLALTFNAKRYLFGIKSLVYKNQGNDKKYYECRKEQIKHHEANPERIENNYYAYIVELYNFIIAQISIDKYEEAVKNIRKLRAIPVKNNNARSLQLESYRFEFWINYKLCKFSDALKLIEEFKSVSGNFKGEIHKVLLVESYILIGIIYFTVKNFSESQHWLNKIINEDWRDWERHYCFALILRLIVFYEQEDYDLIDYQIKNTRYYMEKKNRLYKFETVFLKFLGKTLRDVALEESRIEAFKDFRKEFIELSKDPYESKMFEDFDFISWVDSKIETRAFAEIMKEKARLPQIQNKGGVPAKVS